MKKKIIFSLISTISFFTLVSALSIEDHRSYIALHAPYSSSDVHPYAASITLHNSITYDPTQVLLEAVWYSGATHTTQKLGSLLLSEIKSGQRFLWDNPCTPECAGEYRIYAYCVKPGTHDIIKQISPISDIVTITMSPHDQIGDTPSYAPFFLQLPQKISPKKNSSNTVPLIIAGICCIGIPTIGLALYQHFSKRKILSQQHGSPHAQDCSNSEISRLTAAWQDLLDKRLTQEDKNFICQPTSSAATAATISSDVHFGARILLHEIRITELIKNKLENNSSYSLQDLISEAAKGIRSSSQYDSECIIVIRASINNVNYLHDVPQESNLEQSVKNFVELYDLCNDPAVTDTDEDKILAKTTIATLKDPLKQACLRIATPDKPYNIRRCAPDNTEKEWGKNKRSLQEIFGDGNPLHEQSPAIIPSNALSVTPPRITGPLAHILQQLSKEDKQFILKHLNPLSPNINAYRFLHLTHIRERFDNTIDIPSRYYILDEYNSLPKKDQELIAMLGEAQSRFLLEAILHKDGLKNILNSLIALHAFISDPLIDSDDKDKKQAKKYKLLLQQNYFDGYDKILRDQERQTEKDSFAKRFAPTSTLKEWAMGDSKYSLEELFTDFVPKQEAQALSITPYHSLTPPVNAISTNNINAGIQSTLQQNLPCTPSTTTTTIQHTQETITRTMTYQVTTIITKSEQSSNYPAATPDNSLVHKNQNVCTIEEIN